jgi:hypothetical protein
MAQAKQNNNWADFIFTFDSSDGMSWRSWLSYYATSRKVAGLIPDEAVWFFN